MTVDILEWAAIVAHTVSKVTTTLLSTFFGTNFRMRYKLKKKKKKEKSLYLINKNFIWTHG